MATTGQSLNQMWCACIQCGAIDEITSLPMNHIYQLCCGTCKVRIIRCQYCQLCVKVSRQAISNMKRHRNRKHSEEMIPIPIMGANSITNSPPTPPGSGRRNSDDEDVSSILSNNDDSSIISSEPYDSADVVFDNNDHDHQDDILFVDGLVDIENISNHNNHTQSTNEVEARVRQPCLNAQFQYFGSPSNNLYFYQVHLYGLDGGRRGIVWRAKSRYITHNNLSTPAETRLMFRLLRLLLKCTGQMRAEAMDLIADIVSLFRNEYSCSEIRLPRTIAEARSMSLEGRYSIFANIPHVRPVNIGEHACVSLHSLLDHVLGHGIPLAWLQDYNNIRDTTGINGTKKAQELLTRLRELSSNPDKTAIGYLIFWSDGFLRTFVKQKDNSIWILTVTICPPTGCAISPFHTHCLAIGKSKDNHDEVIDYYMRELVVIQQSKSRYCGEVDSFVDTSFGLLAYIADRPERDSILKTSQGGTYGKRSRHAGAVTNSKLPSCASCNSHLLRQCNTIGDIIRRECNSCCNWNFYGSSSAIKFCLVDADYPKSVSSNHPPIPKNRSMEETHIIPHIADFQWMTTGVELALHQVSIKHWNNRNMASYLRSMVVNESVRKTVWKKAKCIRQNIADNTDVIPSMWKYGYDINIFIDCVMHQLFHGVCPSVIEIIDDILAQAKKKTSAHDYANSPLHSISKLRLDYCKIRLLPNTLWLAEDSLGFSRIMPYVYGDIFSNIQLENSVVTLNILKLVNALYVMIALLMTPRYIHSDFIEMHIKIFLNCCHALCTCTQDTSISEFWETKYNFISLLNLPQQIADFGSLRFYWEGNRERFIQSVKKVLDSLRKTQTYLQSKLTLLHKLTTLEWMQHRLENIQTFNEAMPDEHAKVHYNLFHTHDSIDAIMSRFSRGDVISGFFLPNTPREVHVAFKKGRHEIEFLSFGFTAQLLAVSVCGLHYCKFHLIEAQPIQATKHTIRSMTMVGALMLPYISSNDFINQYTIVYSDWDVLKFNGEKNLPQIHTELHSSTN